MEQSLLPALEQFIVAAKRVTYVGAGKKLLPYRLGSKDLQYTEGDWTYHDSYFGDADFVGQEVVYRKGQPVWAMNYFGRILEPSLISAAEAGAMIQRSLTAMYGENRFLGGFAYTHEELCYTDESAGNAAWFTGREQIERQGVRVYELVYHGGLIKG